MDCGGSYPTGLPDWLGQCHRPTCAVAAHGTSTGGRMRDKPRDRDPPFGSAFS